jgi:hypothetical protein
MSREIGMISRMMSEMISHAVLFPLPFRAYFYLEGTLQTILRELCRVVRPDSYRAIITSNDIKVFTIQMLRYTLQSEEY